MRVSEALTWGTAQIHSSLVSDTPLLDASLILTHFTRLSRVELYTKGDTILSPQVEQEYLSAVEKRTEHFPIAYITGVKEFYGRDFHVTPSVLIPRPDTETAVAITLEAIKEYGDTPQVLDLCTGSGCIGITVALENPTVEITLSDISEDALEVAKENATFYSLRAEIIQGDLFEHLEDRRFTCIVSNPPYVAPLWYEDCTLEVKREPRHAIVDESDQGLSIIENIISQSPLHLHKGGHLVIECDYRQVKAVKERFSAEGFSDITVTADMGERDRVVSGRFMCTRI